MGKVPKLLFLSGFILFLTWLSGFINQPGLKSPLKAPPSATVQNEEILTYSIEGLRQREFKSEIKTKQKVSETASFTSYVISYDSDGLNIFALMNVPKTSPPPDGFPVIIVNHGYIAPEVYSTTQSYRNISDYYAQNGYLVLKPDYRGHGNSEAGKGRVLNRVNYAVDVLNLIAAANSIPEANPEKIAMYGHSMGGEITLRVLEATNKVKAATLWAPVTVDFPESFLYFVRRHREKSEVLAYEEELNRLFVNENFSPISTNKHLDLIKSPFIIHHGTRDESVPFEWSKAFAGKLAEIGVRNTFFYIYEGEDHNFRNGSWGIATRRDLEFFKSQLQQEQTD